MPVVQEFSVLVGFPCPFAIENRFLRGFFVSMLVGIYEFLAFIAPSVGNMSKKKTRGTQLSSEVPS